ncbi:unnamed protein product [Lactuca saligna]|uniref:Uncharacterized protein n=1 Tax=Lactuca saligna TaxID=75948 RepID=A0AA35ZDY5_LACSI|nr:unnamed protein product [Lactuca saligna]
MKKDRLPAITFSLALRNVIMETVDDFDTIDVELDEFFKHKQRSRCKDEFLNTLTDEALDECTIPEINLNDFEGMSEDEEQQENQSDNEGDDEDKLQFQYSTHDPKVKWNKMKPVLGERAKCSAISIIDGKLSDHYAKVWDYGHELIRYNPGNTIHIFVTVNPDNTTTFHKMYTCFKAIKEGWKVGCRRVIGLDGSFLKVQCKGELLTSIGRDANGN